MSLKKGDKIKELAKSVDRVEKHKNLLNDIATLLVQRDISVEEIGDVKRISVTQSSTTDRKTGLPGIPITRTAIQFSPTWDRGPDWPVIERAPSKGKPQRQNKKAKSNAPKGWETAVILPDIQIGFWNSSLDPHQVKLEPTHDERAISVALEVIRDINPDRVVMVGDNLDFSQYGKFLTSAPFKAMIQPAIDRAAELCREVREAAPRARIDWIAGNHEARMAKYIQLNAEGAFGITTGKLNGELRDKWPVMSVPYLCRMDDFDITYHPGYPESYVSLNENLMIIHGHKVVSNGSTTTKYLNDAHQSVIYGHIHRVEYAYRTRKSEKGPRTVMAASPGCLCRIDGAVPSTKSGADEFGRPILQGIENWQQGLAVVQYQPPGVENEWFNYEPMLIFDGRGFFRGKEYKV